MAVAQLRLAGDHRADAAEEVAEHIGAVLLLLIGLHVIGVIGHEDQVVFLLKAEILRQQGAEALAQCLVLQPGLAQLAQQAVLLAVTDLLGCKGHIHQILAHAAGETFVQQGKIGLLLLLVQHAHRLVKVGDHLPGGAVHITAVEVGNIILGRLKPPLQLTDFFVVHDLLLLFAFACRFIVIAFSILSIVCKFDNPLTGFRLHFPADLIILETGTNSVKKK